MSVSNIIYNLSLIHISEPTRLGMISYAVFCLKKAVSSLKTNRGTERMANQNAYKICQYGEFHYICRPLQKNEASSFENKLIFMPNNTGVVGK